MKEIVRGELILFRKRVYIVEMSKVSNGSWKGHRVLLKLLKDKELNNLIIKGLDKPKQNIFDKRMKGGLS